MRMIPSARPDFLVVDSLAFDGLGYSFGALKNNQIWFLGNIFKDHEPCWSF
jgi:hypothetical protein